MLPKERFLYGCDLDSNGRLRWQHQVRFERTLPVEPQRFYPVCIDGVGTAPPEDCGGAAPQPLARARWPSPLYTATWHTIDPIDGGTS
ncbi:MAG: IS1096 element passenger TnpR family protein [Terriglobia bacterium]